MSWLPKVIREIQVFVGASVNPRCETAMSGVHTFLDALPAPATQVERLVLRSLLHDAILEWADSLHAHFHDGKGTVCTFSPEKTVRQCWRGPASAAQLFQRTAAMMIDAVQTAHHRSPFDRLRRHLTQQFVEPLDLPLFAPGVGCSAGSLSRGFRRQFGITISAYLTRVRVHHALRAIASSDDKIEHIAENVGYRSKKNLYRAVKTLTGLTPGSLRDLSVREVEALANAVLSVSEASR